MYKYKAEIEILDKDLIKALKAEEDWNKERSSLVLEKNIIKITAKDIIAFKATLNSLIKLIEAYEKVNGLIQKNG